VIARSGSVRSSKLATRAATVAASPGGVGRPDAGERAVAGADRADQRPQLAAFDRVGAGRGSGPGPASASASWPRCSRR
jgi:hypothetical protein